jgi:dihydrofolate synthase/folylpolyglutamate synthase
MTTINNYEQALAFIHGRPRFKKKPTLQRMRLFLDRLGNPQTGLKYVHVTGTNGKGSTVAMLRSLLMEHGLSVGSFTSPFITRFNERICLNAQPIADEDLVVYTRRVAKVVDQLDQELTSGGPTEFEIDCAIMFCYFADVKPDVVILEVGIGGLWDSTNVIDSPIATAIVTVGYDHMKYLGNTIAEIATQKAGIIKQGSPVVIGKLPVEAFAVIHKTAMQKSAPLYRCDRDFHASIVKAGLYLTIKYQGLKLDRLQCKLGLAGDYQLENAACALTLMQLVLAKLNVPLDVAAIQRAMTIVNWPGRMEVVNESPLMLLDGAHNLPGVQALVKTLQDDFSDRELYLLVGILADKQYQLMMGELASLKNVHLMLTPFAGPSKKRPSALPDEMLNGIHARYPIQQADNWQSGLLQLSREMSADDVLIVTGSLYLISEVRQYLFD